MPVAGSLTAVHPIERLRYLARADDLDVDILVPEAAASLADLASSQPMLVMAARRLVAAHPCCGPLWWASSLVLCADGAGGARDAAARACALLVDDCTGDELAAALPGGAVVVAGASTELARALRARPDLEVRLVGAPLALRGALEELSGGSPATAWRAEESPGALSGADVLVLEATAAGPQGCLVPDGAFLAARARERGVALWAMVGVGRLLPAPLFAAAAARCGTDRLVEVEDIARVVGPAGPGRPAAVLGASDCPAPLELSR